MIQNFNIARMFQAAFGITPPPLVSTTPVRTEVQPGIAPARQAPVLVKQGPIAVSLPVARWQRVKFPAGQYKLTNGSKAAMPDIYLPAATFVELYRTKIEVYTGRVIEHIELDNWSGTIRGLITPGSMGGAVEGSDADFPYNDLALLNQLFTYCDSLGVVGDLFGELGITRINLSNLQLPIADGFSNVQPFSFNFRSDEIVELVLKNNPQLLPNL